MSDPQTWTVIGGFLAILVAMCALVLAVVRAEIAVLAARLDSIDRDLQRLFEHVFARGEST